jgi:titin
LEARLSPAEDPNLNVEWFKDGKPVPTGHRFRTFHDFGIVILDVLYCYAEDSGKYECRATNKLGTDSIFTSVECSEKSGLILTPQIPGEMKQQTLQKIQTLETMKMRTSMQQSSAAGCAPRFTVPISDIADLREGENAHFEARLIPTDDPTLTVEWFWKGKPLKAGSRIRTFCDFGFVILEISPVYPEDSGEYQCRAKNAIGEAVTTATMKCSGKRNIIMDSQLPKGMEGAMDKIANLEGLGRSRHFDSSADDAGHAPEFLTKLQDLMLAENSLAHFETRLTPINDPSMKLEWYHNGEPLSSGSRIKTINDFGFVILEVANVMTRDSGSYTCKAVNKLGEASLSCNVTVKSKADIISDPQLPQSFRSGTEAIHRLEESMWKRGETRFDEPEGRPPKFVTQIANVDVKEGQPAHFDCRVEPIGDGSMQIDWFLNDQPLAFGSRLHTISDFGFVVLDIDWTFKRDSGTYLCRATNKYGVAETKATLSCKSHKGINSDSQLPQGMSLDRLKELETGKIELRQEDESAEITTPKFITQITSRAVGEGEPAHFNCRVEPKHDPKLQVKWFHDGKELASGHRFRITQEFGYVALDILYTYPEDEGEYVCKATNELGEDTTKCELKCKELPAIQLENQVPKGMKKSEYVMQMEATMKKFSQEIFLTEDDVYDSEKRQPPRFVSQIASITDLMEMQATKFECQLAPVGDPNMKVEWFFNGKPLPFSESSKFNNVCF